MYTCAQTFACMTRHEFFIITHQNGNHIYIYTCTLHRLFFIFCVLQMLQKMNDDRTLLGILGPFLVAIVTFILRLILP